MDEITLAEAYEMGRVDACVWNAELTSREVADQHWRDTIRGYNYDRRDQRLLTRLRKAVADGKQLGHRSSFILWLADHPHVTFAFDPEIGP